MSSPRSHRPKTPTPSPLNSPSTPPSKPTLPISPSPTRKSPRNPSNKLWTQEQQRRTFLHHLTQWSLNHDSSPHFHGKISLLPGAGQTLELGRSVTCVLSFEDARRRIVVRLFAPQGEGDAIQHRRRRGSEAAHCIYGQKDAGPRHYTLVIRSGAGWIPARTFFGKIYFARLAARSAKVKNLAGDTRLDASQAVQVRSRCLGPSPALKDSVTVRPLFRRFLALPPELQEMILRTAVGWTRVMDFCTSDEEKAGGKRETGGISLATMFCISREITHRMRPWVYRSTDFAFGLTGFTSFLWHLTPTHRPHIRRLTFRFGPLALLHCIRWLAPDPVFALFEPPVHTSPPGLQFFWRAQLRDLTRELHIHTLTLDLAGVPDVDVRIVVRVLGEAFGGVERWVFVDSGVTKDGRQGKARAVGKDDERLRGLGKGSWRELCKAYFKKYRREYYFLRAGLMRGPEELVEAVMDCDRAFFDRGVGR
ncbi:hypothetical protein P153DRAFT_335176 [Dothidotthia symphoricarpi CBS 119687]|uniref:F-box domain-containing protein n=1 Tax=Dothidotthia symphoricarpi CBS 119687 TaxID=1392245 RepID=A0A6A6APB5_9PLEO|nr:uncharacterized protein P153DRAFT_335176 [Dothidotthia symphoricarpi CBS 119687]KAF2132351.1 hypothetical protein P153DRAFT_335176 [Dothidotthia symphoricarpi CBS 119687]